MTLTSFLKKYRNDDDCLAHIKQILYPKGVFCRICKQVTRFTKVSGRPVYQCSCGFQINPLARTVFAKTTTPLQYWFYAMFLMTATRGGIAAKQLERELGVTYKTAWRMMKQIRILMGKMDGSPLTGIVEVDESFFGGKGVNRAYKWQAGKKKDIIIGMVQRNGIAHMEQIKSTTKTVLVKQIKKNVAQNAHVMTDEHPGYKNLYQEGYFNHHTVNHVDKQYVRKGLFHTNSVEGLWGRIKPGIKGVYRKVSSKYIESYMDEYCFRYNHRKKPREMFYLLLTKI